MINTTQFYGVHTALVTPMRDGNVSYEDLEKLVEFQIEHGVQGLVAVGTTGESPTLNHAEHIKVVKEVVRIAGGRVPVIAGAGSNSTDEAVELTKKAVDAGADALLQVTPYYNKPSQEGLYRHFSKIAEATEKPIILYSIPGRCIIEVSIDLASRLYEKYPHICGIKESGGKNERVDQISRALGKDYLLLSGEDENTLAYMTFGCHGVISVASNRWPKEITEMVAAALKNDFQSAMMINRKFRDIFRDLFIEPNPAPVKYALYKEGIISSPEVKLPLCELQKESITQLEKSLAAIA